MRGEIDGRERSRRDKIFRGPAHLQRSPDAGQPLYALTRAESFSRDYALADQMRRAAVSILSNLAEGFERETPAEFVRFLFIAKGSCGELRAQAMLALDQR